jgi:hypothetical protein
VRVGWLARYPAPSVTPWKELLAALSMQAWVTTTAALCPAARAGQPGARGRRRSLLRRVPGLFGLGETSTPHAPSRTPSASQLLQTPDTAVQVGLTMLVCDMLSYGCRWWRVGQRA